MTRCCDDCTYSTDAVHTRRDYTCYSSESQTYAFIPMPVITATRYYHISVWAQPGSLPKVLNKYHLWSCCLTPPPNHQPPTTNPACSAVTQTLQAGVVKHCDIVRLSQFSSPFLYATDWHTHADHVLPVHIHCAPLSSIFTVRAGACGCHPVLLVIYFVPPVYTRAL